MHLGVDWSYSHALDCSDESMLMVISSSSSGTLVLVPDRFNVPRFMWRELRNAMGDGRKGIPYAPYLMFMIERVSSYRFEKDGLHTVYKIEKTRGAGASRAVRCSPSIEDVPESSRSRSRKEKKMEKFGRWIKAIFTTCTYAARTAYQDRLENREAN